MDCKTARFVLEFNRPHLSELDGDEADALERHLAECPECKLAAKTQRQVDAHLGQAMRGVAVPTWTVLTFQIRVPICADRFSNLLSLTSRQ